MCKSDAFIAMRGLALLVAALSMVSTSTSFAQGGAWTSKANMPTARSVLTSSVVDEKVYVIGGLDQNSNSLATTEEYDPMTNTWTRKADMPTPRFGHCACAVNGRIYVIGGLNRGAGFRATVEEYDPATDTWTAKANMPTARASLSCSAVDGKIYAMGGDTLSGRRIIFLSVAEEYDPMTDTWTAKADLPIPRGSFASSAVGGLIYVMGGWKPGGTAELVEEYHPAFDIWIVKNATIPTPRPDLSASTLNGIIYVIGGQSRGGGSLSTVEAHDPGSDSWTTKAPMPTDRANLTTSSANGRIFAIGGVQYSSPNRPVLSTVEEYDPSAPTSVETNASSIPTAFVLHQNYPNPFNPSTTIVYSLPTPQLVKLKVYDVLGHEVATLVNERKAAGNFQVSFDASKLTSGIYLYRLEAGDPSTGSGQGFVEIKKMILVR